MVSYALFCSFAGSLCDQHDAQIRPYEVLKPRSQKTSFLQWFKQIMQAEI